MEPTGLNFTDTELVKYIFYTEVIIKKVFAYFLQMPKYPNASIKTGFKVDNSFFGI